MARAAELGTTRNALIFLRYVLALGLRRFAESPEVQASVFAGVDAGVDQLLTRSHEAWLAEARQAVGLWFGPGGQHPEIQLGYPARRAVFPRLSLVLQSEAERDDLSVAGDLFRREIDWRPPDLDDAGEEVEGTGRLYRVDEYGVGKGSSVQIGCWSHNGEASELLREIVEHVLSRERGTFAEVGIHGVTASSGGMIPDPDTYPEIRWVPIIGCEMTFDSSYEERHGPKPYKATLLEPRFTGEQ